MYGKRRPEKKRRAKKNNRYQFVDISITFFPKFIFTDGHKHSSHERFVSIVNLLCSLCRRIRFVTGDVVSTFRDTAFANVIFRHRGWPAVCMFAVCDSCARYSRRHNEQPIVPVVILFSTSSSWAFARPIYTTPASAVSRSNSVNLEVSLGNDWPRGTTTRRARSFSIVCRYCVVDS